MGSLRDKLGLNKPKPKASTSPPKSSPAKEEKEKKPPTKVHTPKEFLTHKCGHNVGVGFIENMKCYTCIANDRRERNKRRASKYPMPPRLPDKATFLVIYNAEKEQWSGTLTIEGKVFSGEESTVFNLLRKLDQQFRESTAQSTTKGENK